MPQAPHIKGPCRQSSALAWLSLPSCQAKARHGRGTLDFPRGQNFNIIGVGWRKRLSFFETGMFQSLLTASDNLVDEAHSACRRGWRCVGSPRISCAQLHVYCLYPSISRVEQGCDKQPLDALAGREHSSAIVRVQSIMKWAQPPIPLPLPTPRLQFIFKRDQRRR